MHGGGTPYPMVAVGFFFAMFWVGYIAADGLGMYLMSRVAVGLIGGWCAVSLIDRIERRDPNA